MDDLEVTPQISIMLTWKELGRDYKGSTEEMLAWLHENSNSYSLNMNGVWFTNTTDAVWFKLVWKKSKNENTV